MKKSVRFLLAGFALTFAFGMFTACGEDTDSGNVTSTPSASGSTSSSTPSEGEESSSVVLPEVNAAPTGEELVAARKNALDEKIQGYNFNFNLTGEIGLLGYSGAVEADYQGQYRYNSETNETKFKRATSGLLLYDSTSYVFTKNDQKIKVTMNDEGEVKKTEIVPSNDEELLLINKPIVAMVDNMTADNLQDIKKTSQAGYAYEAKLCFSSENPTLANICDILGGLGTTVSIKGATFDNPLSGISMYFNLANDTLTDFKISTTVSFSVAKADVALTFTYEQKQAKSDIEIPSVEGLIVDDAQISTIIGNANSAILDVKGDEAYSLDIFAENEFDPAWNVLATVDSYTGRLYKNTVDENVWFNHSYKYKAHHEEDGAESYEYAIGNIEDGTVYVVSYKGSNTYTVLENTTVDTQFEYMVSPVILSAANIDCIKQEQDDDVIRYTLYLNKAGAISMQNDILGIINSNDAEGVLDVNNYFNSDYIVEEAEIVIEIEDGKLVGMECLTELKYCPTDGEYTEYNITLTNTIEFVINDRLNKALDYEAPGKADGIFDNLESIL